MYLLSSRIFLRLCTGICLITKVLGGNNDCNPENLIYKCSSTSNLAYQYTEGIDSIRDVLPQICDHLNIRDLSNTESVCRLFQWAVKQVLKQRGPELRITEILEFAPHTGLQAKPLTELINIKPKAILFFLDTLCISPLAPQESVPYEFFAHYLPQLPEDSTISLVRGSNIIDNTTKVLAYDNKALGLYLPDGEGVEIRINALALEIRIDWAESEIVKQFFRKLLPNNQLLYESLGFILFNLHEDLVYSERTYSKAIINYIKQMYKEGHRNLALWGSSINYIQTTYRYPDIGAISFCISISGPRVRSWSLVINIQDSIEKKRRKIFNFKNQIKIKEKKSVAMSLQILDKTQSHEIAVERNKVFSSVFPTLKLMTMTQSRGPIYCLDTDLSMSFEHSSTGEIEMKYDKNIICYLIISHM